MNRIGIVTLAALALVPAGNVFTQTGTPARPVAAPGLELSLWAREPMLKNPVALNFDDQGRLYVVETARRSTVDIDIRAHPSWILDDLANQSVDDLRRFFRTRMAPERSLENAPWLRDRNGDGVHDWHDLMEVKERVHLLEDPANTGRAAIAHVFAEGFNEEINGVIAGVMPWGPDVLVTVYPDLWRLRDTDGDGRADRQESQFRGFGVHAAFDGHDLHGLIMGPDGKIYFSNGDNGFSVTTREGRRLHHPNTGGILRMDPDGSNLEVFATGLRNPQEIAFDDFGNLFAVDNDGDLGDERERFVYITEGSDSGWRLHWQFRDAGWAKFTRQPDYNPWIHERMWVPWFDGQPAHLTPPLTNYSVGPGSLVFDPGTALNEEYRHHFFLIQFPVQKVTTFQTRPRGAGFEMVHERTVLSGMMASAVTFSPDGALFVADWDGLWEPNDKGAIWKLDDPRSAGSPLRAEVRQLLRSGLQQHSEADLVRWLGHADRRIRLRAQFELVGRRAQARLQQVATDTSAPLLARIHSLWGLGQLGSQAGAVEWPFRDSDPEIQAQAAKVAGDLRLGATAGALVQLLGSTHPRVQFHAALSLGKLKAPTAVPALISLLNGPAERDPFLRHAAVLGLAGCASPSELARLASHPSASVRLGAVVALRRRHSAEVVAFLKDPDFRVRAEAVRAIHDDESIPEALPALAALLDAPSAANSGQSDEAVTRRVLNANLRLGGEANASRLARLAVDPSRPMLVRQEAVEALADWDRSPLLDRVEGCVRDPGPRSRSAGRNQLERIVREVLTQTDAGLAQTMTRVVMEQELNAGSDLFARWVQSTNQPSSIRSQALRLLAKRSAVELPSALQTALESTEPDLRRAALGVLAETNPQGFLEFAETRLNTLSLPEQQTAIALLGATDASPAVRLLTQMLQDLLSGKLPPELRLDVLEAARRQPTSPHRVLLGAYESRLPASDPLARYRPALSGGNAAAGREVFRNHVNAQCVRCHEAGGEGYQAGPVLAGIGKRVTLEYLLAALVDPNAHLADGYATVTLTLQDGETLEGILLRQTEQQVTLRPAIGGIADVPRSRIVRQDTSTQSAMPPMGEVLTLLELRDVLAYLGSLR